MHPYLYLCIYSYGTTPPFPRYLTLEFLRFTSTIQYHPSTDAVTSLLVAYSIHMSINSFRHRIYKNVFNSQLFQPAVASVLCTLVLAYFARPR